MQSYFNVENPPLLEIDTLWRYFTKGASIFNGQKQSFPTNCQLRNDRAGHFSMVSNESINNVTPIQPSVPPSFYSFFAQNKQCLSNVFRSIAIQHTQEVESN